SGVISHPATHVGHSRLLWTLRGNTRIQQAFRRVWNMKDGDKLISSFDGLGVFRPPNQATWFDKKTSGQWWHFDQNGYREKARACIQGLVNLVDNTEADAPGFCVLPGSHHAIFDAFFYQE